MATESTEEHEKIKNFKEIIPCSSVDSVAKFFLYKLKPVLRSISSSAVHTLSGSSVL